MLNSRAAIAPARCRSLCKLNKVAATHRSDQRLPAHSTRSTRKILAGIFTLSLYVADGDDFVAAGAAWGGDIDHIAFGFADERARNGRGKRQQPLFDVGLIIAYQLVDNLVAAVLILELQRRAKHDAAVGGQLGDIDHFCIAQAILDLVDAPFDETLLLTRRVIFRIFAQITVRARFGNGLD